MRILKDQERIDSEIENLGLQKIMNCEKVQFAIHQYERGEILSSPENPTRYLLFRISGNISVYGISEDFAFVPIALIWDQGIIGDIEFASHGKSPVFAEATEEVECLALDMQLYESELRHDIVFLDYILERLARTIDMITDKKIGKYSLTDKVLYYLEYQSKDHRIEGIQHMLLQFQCSRRSLQRVLKKLCEEGRIVKEKKGCYRLV